MSRPHRDVRIRPCRAKGCGTVLQFVTPQGHTGPEEKFLPLERDSDPAGWVRVVPSAYGPRAVPLRGDAVHKAHADRELLFRIHGPLDPAGKPTCLGAMARNPRPTDQLDLLDLTPEDR